MCSSSIIQDTYHWTWWGKRSMKRILFNLYQFNFSILQRLLSLYDSISSHSGASLLSQITSLYTVCPSTQIYNYFLKLLSFKLERRKKVTNQTVVYTIFYTDLCSYLYWCFWFLYVDSSYCPVSLHFSLKDSLCYFL